MKKIEIIRRMINNIVSGNPSAAYLKEEDVRTYIWDSLHVSLADNQRPNVWEVEASSDDVRCRGGLESIARCCAFVVRDALKEEKMGDVVTEYCVFCKENHEVRRGVLRVRASELNHQACLDKVAFAKYRDCVTVTSEDIKNQRCEALHKLQEEHEDQDCRRNNNHSIHDSQLYAEYCVYCSWDDSETDLVGDLHVGRLGSNDIVIDNIKVSRSHGEFIRDDSAPSGWAYLDLKSTYGSKRNGNVLFEKALLSDGDCIEIAGICQLILRKL